MLDDFPSTGRVAAIDHGTVRIGIAICDPDRILASPHDVRPAQNWPADGPYYVELTRQLQVAGFVVGLPVHCDGGESRSSGAAREFATWLAEQTGKPVRLFDERFTTVDAQSRLIAGGMSRGKRKTRIDAVAAQVILESFLEASRYGGDPAGIPLADE